MTSRREHDAHTAAAGHTVTTPARRQRLAELDALTDRIQPLLDRLDAIWRAVEADLGWHRRNPGKP